jgi:hypothetical protein
MISTITAPAHTVTPAAPRESERRSLPAGGVTIGTIHEAGTSFSTGQERRSRAMISPASRLSTAAPSSLRITRAYGEPSSTRQSCNPSPTFRREELGRAPASTARNLRQQRSSIDLLRAPVSGRSQDPRARGRRLNMRPGPAAGTVMQRSGDGTGHWSLWRMPDADYARLARIPRE